MEVVLWQLVVIASVLAAYLALGSGAALVTSIGWTAWTFVALAYAPLTIIQLLSAWGTFAVCSSFLGQKQRIEQERSVRVERETEISALRVQLNQVLGAAEVPAAAKSAIESIADNTPDKITVIVGADHLRAMTTALADARRTLCILSGWIGSPLLRSDIQAALRSALKRGVHIYIGYGYESSQGGHEPSGAGLEALSFLQYLQTEVRKTRKGELHVGQFANHEKIIVVDETYILMGSNNWLSNGAFRNTERSLRVENAKLAAVESRRIVARLEKTERGVS